MLILEAIVYQFTDKAKIPDGIHMNETRHVFLEHSRKFIYRICYHARFAQECIPTSGFVDDTNVQIELRQEGWQIQWLVVVHSELAHLQYKTAQIEDSRLDVADDVLTSQFVHCNGASTRQHSETLGHSAFEGCRSDILRLRYQRPETALVAIVYMSLCHEVEHRQTLLVWRKAQTTT